MKRKKSTATEESGPPADGEIVDMIASDREIADAGAQNGEVLGALLTDDEIAVVLSDGDISRRAYELFLGRGEYHGADVDDWLAAERELREVRENSR